MKQLELHAGATEIDNPTVPFRWCFTPEAHRRMVDGIKRGYTYAVLVVMKNSDDGYGFHERREVKPADQSFTFLTFPRPGKWVVSMFLFENTRFELKSNNQADLIALLCGRYLERKRDAYNRTTPSSWQSGKKYLECCANHHLEFDVGQGLVYPMAAEEMVVNIPEGVFAPKPSPALLAFANYFYSGNPDDECDFRRRMLIMTLGFGWVPWLMNESLKRIKQLAFALVQLLFALRGSWSNVLWAFRPSVRFVERLDLPDFKAEEECCPPWNSKIGRFLTPGALVVYAVILAIVGAIGYLIIMGLTWLWDRGLIWIPVLIGLGVLAYAFRSWFTKGREKRLIAQMVDTDAYRQLRTLALQRAQQEAKKLETLAPALVCGDGGTHEVSLKAMPPAMRTFDLRFQSIKRSVCRPFV